MKATKNLIKFQKAEPKNVLEVNEITEVSLVGKGWKPKNGAATIDFLKGEQPQEDGLVSKVQKAVSDFMTNLGFRSENKAEGANEGEDISKAENPDETQPKATEAGDVTDFSKAQEVLQKALEDGKDTILKAIKEETSKQVEEVKKATEAQVEEIKKATEAQVEAVNKAKEDAMAAIQKAVDEAGIEVGRMQTSLTQAGEDGPQAVEKATITNDMDMLTAVRTLLK